MQQEKKKYLNNPDWKRMSEKEYQVHKKRIYSLSWNCQGSRLVSSSSDHTVRLWSMRQVGLQKSHQLKGHSDTVKCTAWHPYDPNILGKKFTCNLIPCKIATGSNDKMLKIWDIRAYKTPMRVQNTKGGSLNIAWSPSGHLIGVGNKQNTLQFFDGKSLTPRGDFFDGVTQINQFQWDVTGNVIFITTLTGQIYLLDGQNPVQDKGGNEQIIQKLGGHTALCYTLAVDRNGKYIASGGPDALVCLWDARELYIEKTISQLDHHVRNLSFSHDGRFLAISSLDKSVVIYDVNGVIESTKGDEYQDAYFAGYHQPVKVHSIRTKNSVDSVEWSPSGYYLAFGGEDKKDEGPIHVLGGF